MPSLSENPYSGEFLPLFDLKPQQSRPVVQAVEHVPHARDSETSRAAAEDLSRSGRFSTLRERVFELIVGAGNQGVTRQEAASALNRVPSDLTTAFKQLEKSGRIKKIGTRVNPRSGYATEVFAKVGK